MLKTIPTWRKGIGWSQARLAKELGVAQSTVFRIENGQEPSGPVKKLLAQIMAADPTPSGKSGTMA